MQGPSTWLSHTGTAPAAVAQLDRLLKHALDLVYAGHRHDAGLVQTHVVFGLSGGPAT